MVLVTCWHYTDTTIFIMKANIDILTLRRPKNISKIVQDIIETVVSMTLSRYNKNNGLHLAALFDMFVACEYYSFLANKGWTYCSYSPDMLLYAYTNTCPRCLGHDSFVFTKGNKPESGQIGMITTEILCEMLAATFKHNDCNVQIFKASEPVDVLIYEPKTELMIMAEVKAAPLFTVPIGCLCEKITEEIGGVLVTSSHSVTDNPFVRNCELFLFFPRTSNHKEAKFALNIDWTNEAPFFDAICRLIKKDKTFLDFYFSYWNEAYDAYSQKDRSNPVYWLTNACGLPTPRPDNWTKRRSGGFETISDAKTSVGMDRTDDIKKGIYQVLKLGAEYKPRYKNIKTALISNIHAVRHHDDYLQCVKDIIWTIDESRKVRGWNQLTPDTPLYNLFDGIIAFTQSDIRDVQMESLFKF